MRVAEIIGKVTLSRCHPSLRGARWVIGVPLDRDGFENPKQGRGEPFVIYDEMGGGEGSLIAVSEGAEAAAPFHPQEKPIDAYCAAILDTLDISAD